MCINFNKNTHICEKYLVNQKKCCTFAPLNEFNACKGTLILVKLQNIMTKFQEFYANVRNCDAQLIRQEVVTRCEVSQVSFYNWQKGVFEPASHYWAHINAVAVEFGYDKVYVI